MVVESDARVACDLQLPLIGTQNVNGDFIEKTDASKLDKSIKGLLVFVSRSTGFPAFLLKIDVGRAPERNAVDISKLLRFSNSQALGRCVERCLELPKFLFGFGESCPVAPM